MDFKTQYSFFLQQIENRILEVIPQSAPNELYEPFRYIMKEGGKRLRPVITLIGCGISGEDPLKALDSAVAIEILHNFTLVHDDIMDNSPLRRGRQTIHEKWNSAIAILTGDVMIGYAYKLLPSSTNHSRADEILSIFSKELIEVCEGQVFDMVFNEKKDVTIADYINMIDKKTARLIETSAVIGAHIGFGDSIEIDAMKNIAHNIGLAFQIQDDLLDMTANQADFGKKIGKDVVEGKKTYLILKAVELVNDTLDRQLIDKFMNNNGLDECEVIDMDNLFRKYRIYETAQCEIDKYFATAESFYPKLKKNMYTDMLKWLVSSINKRII